MCIYTHTHIYICVYICIYKTKSVYSTVEINTIL